MKRGLSIVMVLLITSWMAKPSVAGVNDCQNLYVGRIWVEGASGGLHGVVFLDHPTSSSGSYWVYFNAWSPDEKKAALALLTAAKISQHRMNVVTTEARGCEISVKQTDGKSLWPTRLMQFE